MLLVEKRPLRQNLSGFIGRTTPVLEHSNECENVAALWSSYQLSTAVFETCGRVEWRSLKLLSKPISGSPLLEAHPACSSSSSNRVASDFHLLRAANLNDSPDVTLF